MPRFEVQSGEKTFEVDAPDLQTAAAAVKTQDGAPTLDQRFQEMTGIDPTDPNRPALIPLRENPKAKGETEWVMPQIGVDLIKSFLLPGHVLKGGTYNAQDAARFTMDYALPMTQSRGSVRRPAAKTSRQALIESAPSDDDLLDVGGKLFEGIRKSGAKLDENQYFNTLSDVQSSLDKYGFRKSAKKLFPKLRDTIKGMEDRIGTGDVDFTDLHNFRQELADAAESGGRQGMIANKIQGIIDDAVENTMQRPEFAQARAAWRAGKKAQDVTEMVRRAQFQASGFENGIRIEARRLLRNSKKLRGWTPDEVKVLEEIEGGTPLTKVLRFASTLGPKRSGDANLLRTLAGAALGSASGIPGGELAVPMAGMAAGKAAQGATLNATEYLRALAASGGHIAPPSAQVPAMRKLAETLAARSGPVAATQLPMMTQPKSDQDKLAELLAAGRL